MNGRIKQFGDNSPTQNKLTRLGKIKVGMKAQNAAGKEFPKSLDYFRATGKYADKFDQAFGKEPKSIGIVFVSDNLLDTCNERLELRDHKGSLVGSGDGVNFELWAKKGGFEKFTVKEAKDLIQIEKFCERFNTEKYTAEWYTTLTLTFIIPKIKDVLGVWVFETKAKASTIPNIRSVFDFVQERAKTIVSIPFDLIVEKVKSQKPGDAKTYTVVSLVPNISDDKIDDIRAYLGKGNSVFDVKQLLEKNDAPKELPPPPDPTPPAKVKESKKNDKPFEKKEGELF